MWTWTANDDRMLDEAYAEFDGETDDDMDEPPDDITLGGSPETSWEEIAADLRERVEAAEKLLRTVTLMAALAAGAWAMFAVLSLFRWLME